MPVYCYECESCDIKWEIKKPSTRVNQQEICPECGYKGSVSRDYLSEGVSVQESTKTLGSRADKNSNKISTDEKEHIKSKSDSKPRFSGKLPEGAKIFNG